MLGLGAMIGIGAAGSALGGLGSYFGAKYQSDKSIDLWREQAAYNTPANQMQRLREAGLNPNLIYSQMESGNMSAPPQISGFDNAAKNGVVSGFQGLEMLLQAEKTKQEIETQKAQTANINADTLAKSNENSLFPIYSEMRYAQLEGQLRHNENVLQDSALKAGQRKKIISENEKILNELKILDITYKHLNHYGYDFPRNLLEGVKYLHGKGVNLINDLSSIFSDFNESRGQTLGITPRREPTIRSRDWKDVLSKHDIEDILNMVPMGVKMPFKFKISF